MLAAGTSGYTGSMRRARKRSYKPRARNKIVFRYKPQHGVIVICRDETHQRQLYDRLAGDGLKCKVVVV